MGRKRCTYIDRRLRACARIEKSSISVSIKFPVCGIEGGDCVMIVV
jgi:hypothetical protein